MFQGSHIALFKKPWHIIHSIEKKKRESTAKGQESLSLDSGTMLTFGYAILTFSTMKIYYFYSKS